MSWQRQRGSSWIWLPRRPVSPRRARRSAQRAACTRASRPRAVCWPRTCHVHRVARPAWHRRGWLPDRDPAVGGAAPSVAAAPEPQDEYASMTAEAVQFVLRRRKVQHNMRAEGVLAVDRFNHGDNKRFLIKSFPRGKGQRVNAVMVAVSATRCLCIASPIPFRRLLRHFPLECELRVSTVARLLAPSGTREQQ